MLNNFAFENALLMSMTLETSHFEMSPVNTVVPKNILCMSVTREMSHFEMSPSNTFVRENIRAMAVTLDTSQFEMSPLNCVAPQKVADMSFTLDTSHFEGNFRQSSTALSSCVIDCGENPLVPHSVSERSSLHGIDPDEPSNMRFLVASE